MAALPTGTITFLFTDIEGSSSRWEQHREAMRTALARHDAILRQTIEGHGGVVFKTVGDAFCAAFATAPDALEAALVAQRALYAENWGAVGPLRVRMALHTGTADQRENDYFGPALNRVARLVDAGHGGQILLSLATQALVQDQLPPGMELRDLGVHRLKDLSQPEHIFQAVIPDLPADFAPLHTLDNRPNNLPAQPTPFIGREREVAAVRQRLLHPDIRLITLTGPGGIGKTRLGLRVAAEVLNDFPDGVYFVALAPISDPMLVSVTVAQTLGVKETSGESLLDSLKAYLREKQLLLLLDNFEQVVVAAPLITELLAAAHGLKVLVTSRASLHLQGEREFPVPPLALPDPKHLPALDTLSQYEAVELFIQRAQAVNPDFQVTNATAPAVAEICVRLDGLPLAIELAAARSKLLSPQALLQRLQHRLQVLTGGARDLPARQQTLRSTIDWSFSLLEAGEQTLFARLGVFVGGFSVEAAETVCHESGIGDQGSGGRGQESGNEGQSTSPSQIPTPDSRLPIPVLDGLQSLLDKSLLHQVPGASGEPRFRMLEIIREYALERLAARGEVEATERTHASYYLTLAEAAAPELQGSQQGAWLEQLEMEHDNLRAALRWSLNRGEVEVGLRLGAALWRLWHMRGYVSEGREWLEKLLPLSEHSRVSPSVRAQALNAAGVLAQQQGDYSAAVPLLEQALALSRELGDKSSISASLHNLGKVAADQGDYAAAYALWEESLALRRALRDKSGIAAALNNLGVMALQQGDYGRAVALLEEGMTVSQELGNKWLVAAALDNLGAVARHQGDFARAAARYDASLALFRELENKWGTAIALHDLGMVAHYQRDDERAAILLRESLSLRWELGEKGGIASSLEGLAGVAGARGHLERAARLLGAATGLRDAIGAPILPTERADYDQTLATLRTALRDEAFAAAWAEGHAMTLEQAIAYALHPEPLPEPTSATPSPPAPVCPSQRIPPA